MCDHRSFDRLLVMVTSFLMFQGGSFSEICAPRPYYNIAHMQNSLKELEVALSNGANAAETDVRFAPNGKADHLYHGLPCDCMRNCEGTENLPTYLERIKNLSTPSNPDYKKNFVLILFDIKSTRLDPHVKYSAGADLASKLVTHLWNEGNVTSKLWVIVYVESFEESDVFLGFREYFAKNGFSHLLPRIGYEIAQDSQNRANDALRKVGVKNVWRGDGITNCFSFLTTNAPLEKYIKERDGDGLVKKVYKWTIDLSLQIKDTLRLTVDGMITNVPQNVATILQEPEFRCLARLATIEDNPFTRFTPPPGSTKATVTANNPLNNDNGSVSAFEQLAGTLYRFLRGK